MSEHMYDSSVPRRALGPNRVALRRGAALVCTVFTVFALVVPGVPGARAQATEPGDEPGESRRDHDATGNHDGEDKSREGRYRGVTPGKSPAKERKRKNTITWIGFQLREGGAARVFLRLANELPFEQSMVGDTLVVHIAGARYGRRNIRRPLDLHHFPTALLLVTNQRVSRRRARKGKPARQAGIEVRIRFMHKEDAGPAQASMKTEPDGYTYLYLDFPAPSGSGTIRVSEPEPEKPADQPTKPDDRLAKPDDQPAKPNPAE